VLYLRRQGYDLAEVEVLIGDWHWREAHLTQRRIGFCLAAEDKSIETTMKRGTATYGNL
jgi:hypothetical protein